MYIYLIAIAGVIIVEAFIVPWFVHRKENRKVRNWLGTIRDCASDDNSGTKRQIDLIIKQIQREL